MKLAYDPNDGNRIVWRYYGGEDIEHSDYPTVQIPDDEFPTCNKLKGGKVSTSVMNRLNNKHPNFPSERTPLSEGDVPWKEGEDVIFRWNESDNAVDIDITP